MMKVFISSTSLFGFSLVLLCLAAPQIALADTAKQEEATDNTRQEAAMEALSEARRTLAQNRPQASEDSQDSSTSTEEDTIEEQASEESSAEEAVAQTLDQATRRADEEVADPTGEEQVAETITTAHDAAIARSIMESEATDEEIEAALGQENTGLDRENVNRLRALFDRLNGEDGPEAIAHLREVGSRIVDAAPKQLPLRPYVHDPRWNEAMALLADDDCKEALELATEVLGPPAVHADGEPAIQYAFARMQLCAGQATAGRATMRELTELSTPVGDLARRALGQAVHIDTDDGAADLNTLINRSRARASNGEVDEALAELRALREELDSNWDGHRVRLAEARILENDGRLEDAAQAYLGVYRMSRWWRSSDRIVSEIESAEERMDRTIIPFGDRIDRMTDLISRGRYRHARSVSAENARLRGVSGSEIRGWTRFRQGLQNERERNRNQAVSQFEEAETLVKDPEIRPRLYFGWARALRRTGGEDEAVELYKRLCDEYPANHLCSQSLYEAGRLLQYQNEHQQARELFADVVGLHPFSPYAPDALWRFALSAYLEEDFEAAIPPLHDLVAHYSDIQDASELTVGLKARYWLGVNYLRLGDEENARLWLQTTIDEGALTWYGALAATRLEDAGLPARIRIPTKRLTQENIEDFGTLRLAENPRLAMAAELTRIGLYKDALREVRSQESLHPTPEGATQLRAGLHLALDEPNWGHWIMKSVISESGPTHRTIRDWGYAFPLNYIDLSHKWGSEYGVSPYLVQAIMRQESGFRPTVQSYAGAMGLMQLMPGTARYTSRRFMEDRSITNRQILDTDTNVRLGTMYIRIHIAHAADQPSLALAGYNAGPAPLRSWVERYGDREIDAWVESITYRETRGYVRKVMTSYITYQGLYGDGELPRIELKLPDELRSWGELPEVKDAEEGEPVSMLRL